MPNFYPRSPCGERQPPLIVSAKPPYFYPRSPCGERLWESQVLLQYSRFLSTLSLRRATILRMSTGSRDSISIHALLAESDAGKHAQQPTRPNFYPRSPCGERLHIVGGARNNAIHFYPRSPCGERHAHHFPALHDILISIHALLAESDKMHTLIFANLVLFLSTLSLRRATLYINRTAKAVVFLSTLSLRRATAADISTRREASISIHALLAESDATGRIFRAKLSPISIHALLAESDACTTTITICIASFLSTLSLRRATLKPPIKSHRQEHFYPRSPCGERQASDGSILSVRYFYPRSPCGERRFFYTQRNKNDIFLSTLSLRRATS